MFRRNQFIDKLQVLREETKHLFSFIRTYLPILSNPNLDNIGVNDQNFNQFVRLPVLISDILDSMPNAHESRTFLRLCNIEALINEQIVSLSKVIADLEQSFVLTESLAEKIGRFLSPEKIASTSIPTQAWLVHLKNL